MPNDPQTAILAARRQRMNGAHEAVERVPPAGQEHFDALVVFVSANFTLCHMSLLQRFHPTAEIKRRMHCTAYFPEGSLGLVQTQNPAASNN
jgi:hypothetical protein